jgi:hypothetical protein
MQWTQFPARTGGTLGADVSKEGSRCSTPVWISFITINGLRCFSGKLFYSLYKNFLYLYCRHINTVWCGFLQTSMRKLRNINKVNFRLGPNQKELILESLFIKILYLIRTRARLITITFLITPGFSSMTALVFSCTRLGDVLEPPHSQSHICS